MDISSDDHERILNWAERHLEIKKVWLYGSRARGDNKLDSDIDLAIEMPIGNWFGWHSIYKEKPDLSLSAEAHLEWYQPNEGLVYVGKGVKKDGVLLYSTSWS